MMPSASTCLPAVLTGETAGTLGTLSAPSSPQRQQITNVKLFQVHDQMLLAACQPPHVLAALYSNALQQQQLQQEQHRNALLQQCFAARNVAASTLPMQHVMPVSCSPMHNGAFGAAAGMLPLAQVSHSWLLQQAAADYQSSAMGAAGVAAQQQQQQQQQHQQAMHAAASFGLDPHAMAGAGFGSSQAPRQRRHSHLGFAQPAENRRPRFSVNRPPAMPQHLAPADGAAAFAGMAGPCLAYDASGRALPGALAGAYAARARRSSWCPPSSSHADLAMGFVNGAAMHAAEVQGAGMLAALDMQPQAQQLQQLLLQQRRASETHGYSTSQPGSPTRATASEGGMQQPLPALQYGLALGGSPPSAAGPSVPAPHHAQHQQQRRLVSSLSLSAVGGATAAELQQAINALSGMTVTTDCPAKQQRQQQQQQQQQHQQQQQQRAGGIAAFWQREAGAAPGSAPSSLSNTPTGRHASAFDQLLDQQLPASAELPSDAAAKAAGLQEYWAPSSPTGRSGMPGDAAGTGPAAPWHVEGGAMSGRDTSDQQLRKNRLMALLDTKRTLAALAEEHAMSADACGAHGAEAAACGCQAHSDRAGMPTPASMLAADQAAGVAERRRSSSSGSAGYDSSNKLFVGNIGWWVTEEDLLYWFSKFGTVTNVKIMYNSRKMHKPKDKWRSREYGFVDFSSHEEASRAIMWMDGVEVAELMKDNSGIIVQYAKPTHE